MLEPTRFPRAASGVPATSRLTARAARQRAQQNLPKSRGLYAACARPHKANCCGRAPEAPPTNKAMNSIDPTRAVIDTNALLDWLVFGDAAASSLGRAVADERMAWLATARMLDELGAVLSTPLAVRWELARKHALTIDTASLATRCEQPALAGPGRLICRDGNDQMFIDLALAHGPCWLITRDRALLALRRRAAERAVLIATPAQWWPHAEAPAVQAVSTTTK